MGDNWRVCLRLVSSCGGSANTTCQSYLQRHRWRLSPGIWWHLRPPAPSAHSHSCQSSEQSSECGKKNNWREKKNVLLCERRRGWGLNSPARQLSWQIKPCLTDISGLCQMWEYSSLFVHTSIYSYFLTLQFFKKLRQKWGPRRQTCQKTRMQSCWHADSRRRDDSWTRKRPSGVRNTSLNGALRRRAGRVIVHSVQKCAPRWETNEQRGYQITVWW